MSTWLINYPYCWVILWHSMSTIYALHPMWPMCMSSSNVLDRLPRLHMVQYNPHTLPDLCVCHRPMYWTDCWDRTWCSTSLIPSLPHVYVIVWCTGQIAEITHGAVQPSSHMVHHNPHASCDHCVSHHPMYRTDWPDHTWCTTTCMPPVTLVYLIISCTGQIDQITHGALQPSYPLWPLCISSSYVPDRLTRSHMVHYNPHTLYGHCVYHHPMYWTDCPDHTWCTSTLIPSVTIVYIIIPCTG